MTDDESPCGIHVFEAGDVPDRCPYCRAVQEHIREEAAARTRQWYRRSASRWWYQPRS